MKLQQRFASFLLCLVIMITGLVGYIPGYATETLTNGNLSMANSQIESETLADSTIVDSNIAVGGTAAVGSEKILLPDIVKEDINASQFIGRSPAKETNLNTFVFKNQDGTQTMKVYSHPVKYIDEMGGIQDISTDIKVNKDGTFETKANSIKTTFSKVLKDGITLKHDMVNIRLVSDKVAEAKISADNKIVSYVYDDKTTLEYSLTYTGFKEDIVVNEYTGQTEYEFTLHTNGLTLVKENGSYFLKDSKNNIKATIGDIIIFTADERNNTFGDMTHETITANQEYVITIHVDSAYLKDSKTKYPIRIDPTIEINYDEDGAGAIEDVTLNQNTTYSGTSGSLYVGRSTDGSLNRVLMRFPNLSLTGITASQITDANVEIRDILCQSDEDMVIECRPYLSTAPSWSESQTVTWNSVGSSFYGSIIDSHEVSYGQGNATGSGSSHRYRFDITSLACNWAAGTQSPAKGIVFKATNTFENQTGDNIQYWKKTFASYNRSSNKPSLSMSYIPGISINASESSVVEGNSITLTATTNSNSPISWTSSHQGIAIVGSNGVVSGINAGSAVITASVTENGVTISDSCTVYVTIEDGVYYIKNNNSLKYLQAEDYGLDNMDMILQNSKYADSVSEQTRISQMWKIFYIGGGYYTIRPMSKLSMSWDYSTLELMLFEKIDPDTFENTDEYTRWMIENTSGYTIKNASCDYALQIENSSTNNNAYALLATAANNNNCKWTLEKIDSAPSGVVLYDTTTDIPASGFTRYITPNESLGVIWLKLNASAYSSTSNSQSVLTWTSSNPNIATVNSEGTVMGISPGTAIITVSAYSKSSSYTISVTQIANGEYMLKNKQSGYYADIKNKVMANGTIIHQWQYHSGNTQKWRFKHTGDGYYTIQSANTQATSSINEYYLGVVNDSTDVNDDIVLRTGSVTDGMKWKITVTDSGAYRLTPKNGELDDYALATSSSSATNGARLMQGEYWDNNSYCDEWIIEEFEKRAIFIIPGMLGSELETEDGQLIWASLQLPELSWPPNLFYKMKLSEAGTSIYAVRSRNDDNYGARDTYKTLYEYLNTTFNDRYHVVFFDYDFRLSNEVSAQKLEEETAPFDKVIFVAHSMGGLVVSKYLSDSEANRAKTEALIALGVPFLGSAKCINGIENGGMFSGIKGYLTNGMLIDVSPNSYAAYQLIPTSRYQLITGHYPVKIGDISYSNAMTPLKNTAWGKTSAGTTKLMFDAAEDFHDSLYVNDTHIINRSSLNVYTIAGTGLNTIVGVELSENDYSIELLYASNNGDGTVLLHSAGCGSPDYIFEGVGHVGLVKNAEVIAQIATIINSTYDNQVNLNMLSDDSVSLQTKQVTSKMVSEKIIINEKGWIEGLDNRRIIIYAASDSIVYCEGKKITVKDEIAYDSNNNKVGSVWTLGSKNQRVYVLNNGNYSVSRTTKFKVEYINAGYYQQIVEYSISDNYHTMITIPDFSVFSTISNDVIDGVTVDVASVDEINQMNS